MALVRTSLVGYDRDGQPVFRLKGNGNYFGATEGWTAADVEAYRLRFPQQDGTDPALYRRQHGPITKEKP